MNFFGAWKKCLIGGKITCKDGKNTHTKYRVCDDLKYDNGESISIQYAFCESWWLKDEK